jgi:hypothetical protein
LRRGRRLGAALLQTDGPTSDTPITPFVRDQFGVYFRDGWHTGTSLEQAAQELNISTETARSQLKAVFAKTDTHRQSELVALLGSL